MSNEATTAVTAPAADTGSAAPQPATAAPAAAPAPEAASAQPPAATPPAASTTQTQPAVPESYSDFTMPEGLALDADVGNDLKAFAKEKGLSQAEAQKLADMGAAAVQKTQAAYQAQLEKMQAQWVSDSRADKEFGGDRLSENLAVAKRALDSFGSPELAKLLDESGLGNHPEIIRYNFRVAQAISEDRLVPGSTKPASAADARSFYPNSKMN